MNNSKKSLKLRSLKLKNKRTKKSKKNLRKMMGGHKVDHQMSVYYNEGAEPLFSFTEISGLTVSDDENENYKLMCEECGVSADIQINRDIALATIDHKRECSFNKENRDNRKIMEKADRDWKYIYKQKTKPTSPTTKKKMRNQRIARRESRRASKRA